MASRPSGRLLIVICVFVATIFSVGSVWAQAQGTVTPNQSVLPGQQIAIAFTGFPPNSELIRWVTPPNGAPSIPFSGNIITDENGDAAWHFTVPGTGASGTWAVMARPKKAPSSTRATAAAFRVIPLRTTVSATANVAPVIGKAQTRFAFTAPGFQANQRVYAWANGPNDENIDLELTIRADSAGVASWNWTAPTDSAPGRWRMVIRDTANADQPLPARYVVDFTIEE
jgi:hypothetical protein